MLLILSTEYNLHQSALSEITSDQETITINSSEWIYCQVTNEIEFDLFSVNLNSDNFLNDMILPANALINN
jgi:hypothetical protein